jgi:hypothetical protein
LITYAVGRSVREFIELLECARATASSDKSTERDARYASRRMFGKLPGHWGLQTGYYNREIEFQNKNHFACEFVNGSGGTKRFIFSRQSDFFQRILQTTLATFSAAIEDLSSNPLFP